MRSGQHNVCAGETANTNQSHSWSQSILRDSGSHQTWHTYHHSDREGCTQLYMTGNIRAGDERAFTSLSTRTHTIQLSALTLIAGAPIPLRGALAVTRQDAHPSIGTSRGAHSCMRGRGRGRSLAANMPSTVSGSKHGTLHVATAEVSSIRKASCTQGCHCLPSSQNVPFHPATQVHVAGEDRQVPPFLHVGLHTAEWVACAERVDHMHTYMH